MLAVSQDTREEIPARPAGRNRLDRVRPVNRVRRSLPRVQPTRTGRGPPAPWLVSTAPRRSDTARSEQRTSSPPERLTGPCSGCRYRTRCPGRSQTLADLGRWRTRPAPATARGHGLSLRSTAWSRDRATSDERYRVKPQRGHRPALRRTCSERSRPAGQTDAILRAETLTGSALVPAQPLYDALSASSPR